MELKASVRSTLHFEDSGGTAAYGETKNEKRRTKNEGRRTKGEGLTLGETEGNGGKWAIVIIKINGKMDISLIVLGAMVVLLVLVVYGLGRRLKASKKEAKELSEKVKKLTEEKKALIQRIMINETFGSH